MTILGCHRLVPFYCLRKCVLGLALSSSWKLAHGYSSKADTVNESLS